METTNEMTAERSLEIISRTIEQSRRSMEKNAGMPMVIWGVLNESPSHERGENQNDYRCYNFFHAL